MAREPHPKLTTDPSPARPDGGDAPSMFSRPTDAPDPLPPLRGSEHVQALHLEWQHLSSTPAGTETDPWRRLGRRARRYVHRGLGSADHDVVADLIRAVDAVSARCDELATRLAAQQVVVSEMADIFSEELTRIRSAVAPPPDQP